MFEENTCNIIRAILADKKQEKYHKSMAKFYKKIYGKKRKKRGKK